MDLLELYLEVWYLATSIQFTLYPGIMVIHMVTSGT